MHRNVFRNSLALAAGIAAMAFLISSVIQSTEVAQPTEAEQQVNEIRELALSANPFDRVTGQATFGALGSKYLEEGIELPACMDLDLFSVIIDPNTPAERMDEVVRWVENFYQSQLEAQKVSYNDGSRWTTTATNAGTGSAGDPIDLTWAVVADGVNTPQGPSDLIAEFDASFPSHNTWVNKMGNAFQRWDNVLGSSYTEVAYDDGANQGTGGNNGILGVRADVRIGGGSIDGSSGVLAYNYFPNNGDMVMDTDDNFTFANPGGNYTFFKNVLMHEHGHGMGFGHVQPTDQTKLMEPFASSAFLGWQDDDIRGGQRFYGDALENNDGSGTATDFGALSDTLFTDNLSIDRGSDVDWYKVTLNAGSFDVAVTPVGSTYLLGDDGGPAPVLISTNLISDPDFEVLTSALVSLGTFAANGAGVAETGTVAIPSSGDYFVRVYRKAGTGNNIQRYSMQLIGSDVSTDVATGVPSAGLNLTVAPNPFNPLTKVRFSAPAAGAYSVEIYDVSGRLVRTLRGQALQAGTVETEWNGRDDAGNSVSSGVYLLRGSIAGQEEIRRATLIR